MNFVDLDSSGALDWCARCSGLTEHYGTRCLWCGQHNRFRVIGWSLLGLVLLSLLGLLFGCGPAAQPVLIAEKTASSIYGPDAGTRLVAFPLDPGAYRLVAWACSSQPDGLGSTNAQLNPDGVVGPAVATPLCSEQVPARWEGRLEQGANVTLQKAPPGTIRYTAHLEAWALP